MFLDFKPPHSNITTHPVSVISFTYLFPKEKFYNISFIDDIYTNDIGSILWNKLREEKALCYDYYNDFTMFSNNKFSYNIYVKCKKDNLREVEEVVKSSFYNLGHTILNNEYLAKYSYNRLYSTYSKTKLNPIKNYYMHIPFYHRLNINEENDEIMAIYKKFKDNTNYLLSDIEFNENPIIVTSLEK